MSQDLLSPLLLGKTLMKNLLEFPFKCASASIILYVGFFFFYYSKLFTTDTHVYPQCPFLFHTLVVCTFLETLLLYPGSLWPSTPSSELHGDENAMDTCQKLQFEVWILTFKQASNLGVVSMAVSSGQLQFLCDRCDYEV